MARFMALALCLVLPSLVATAGMEAWGDDASALLQVDTAMASIQTESFAKSVVALRSLLAVAQNAAREHSASSADSTEFYMSTVQPQMEEASNFIVNKLATLSATNKSKSKATPCVMCWVTTVIDALTMMYDVGGFGSFSSSLAEKCSPAVLIVWWLTGMLTMTLDQKLSIPEAMDMLAQQFTSVGYGSSTQDSVGLKIFHGIHGIVSQMTVNRVTTELFDTALHTFEKTWTGKMGMPVDLKSASVNLLAITVLTTFIFALDLGGGTKLELLDGFYQALVTMTTIGYGDKAPNTQWGKAIAPVTLPMLTQAFSRWNDAAGPEAAEKNAEVAKAGPITDAEVCQCMGKNFCAR